MSQDPTRAPMLDKHAQIAGEGKGSLGVSRVRPAYQQVADQLLDLVLSGQLAPGDRFPPEAELASSFGVSRSTVREALRVLASRDLIETTRGTTGGTFVRTIEVRQVREYLETTIGLMSGGDQFSVSEMLEVRDALEVPAARLASVRRDDSHVVELDEAIEREKRTRGRGLKFREHRNFHGVIVQASGNAVFELMTEPMFRVLQTKFLDPTVPDSFWRVVDEDHRRIADAIRDRDGDAAAASMHDHLVRLRQAYRE